MLNIGEYVNDFVEKNNDEIDCYYMGGACNGLYSGFGRILWVDGTQYIGCFKNGEKHGFGAYSDKDNVVHLSFYNGNWAKNGRVVFIGENRLCFYNYKDDVEDGQCFEIQKDNVITLVYKNGEMTFRNDVTYEGLGTPFCMPKEEDINDFKILEKNKFSYDRKGKDAIWKYEENLDEIWLYSVTKNEKKNGLSLRYSKIADCFYLNYYSNDEIIGKYIQISENKFVYGDYVDGYLNGNICTWEDDVLTLSKADGKTINVAKTFGKIDDKNAMVSLDELVGLSKVKREVKRIKAYVRKNKEDNLNIHMCFTGNPGTGKTCVARLLANILYEEGILPFNRLIETDRSGLVAEYIGQTESKTKAIIDKAMGGVLFIDEAYTLDSSEKIADYGSIAVAMLLKEMEDKRGKFCCILAGYKKEMDNLLSSNPGFESRIQFHIDFPNYSLDELMSILEIRLEDTKYQISDEALFEIKRIILQDMKDDNFSNARAIRNILDKIIMIQNERTIDDLDNRTIEKDDVIVYENEQKNN